MTRRKPFPVGRVRENEEWLQRCLKEFVPLWRHYAKYLACDSASRFGIETLLETQQTVFNQLAMTWKWLPPGQRREFEDCCAPMWIEFSRLREQNAAKAKAMLARRQATKKGKRPSLASLMGKEGKPKPTAAQAIFPHLRSVLALMPGGVAMAKGTKWRGR